VRVLLVPPATIFFVSGENDTPNNDSPPASIYLANFLVVIFQILINPLVQTETNFFESIENAKRYIDP